MRITLPLPPKELSPNARIHHMVKARAVKGYRRAAWAYAFCRTTQPRWKQATAQATFYFKLHRKRDKDNLLASLKPAFDGMADAGVIADDSGLTHLPVIIEYDKANPRVEIEVHENTDGPS